MSNSDGVDPLASLFVDSYTLDRKLLADTLQRYAGLHRNGEIEFTWDGEQLTVRQKLLVFLLAKKALKESGVIEREYTSPSEIEKETGWSGGSIRPNLAKLKKEKYVKADSSEEGGYYVPNNALQKVSEILRESGDRDE